MARLAVSVSLGGEDGVAPEFVPSLDVTGGGVLLALPALLAVGLLRHTDQHFTLPRGYYSLYSIFLLLGFMALARIKSMEKLRYEAPGEWGKLLGLDRVPEVRTVRLKLKHLAEHGQPMPRLWQQRIAAMTYRKRPGDDWPVTEFTPYEVRLVGRSTCYLGSPDILTPDILL